MQKIGGSYKCHQIFRRVCDSLNTSFLGVFLSLSTFLYILQFGFSSEQGYHLKGNLTCCQCFSSKCSLLFIQKCHDPWPYFPPWLLMTNLVMKVKLSFTSKVYCLWEYSKASLQNIKTVSSVFQNIWSFSSIIGTSLQRRLLWMTSFIFMNNVYYVYFFKPVILLYRYSKYLCILSFYKWSWYQRIIILIFQWCLVVFLVKKNFTHLCLFKMECL